MTKTQTFSNTKNMPQALKWQEEKLIEALRVSQPDRGDTRTRSVTKPEVSGWSKALSWFALIKTLEGREQRQRCAEVSDHKQKCIVKQSYTVILSWAKPVTFPVVLVQNCLCVGLTCQWPQSPYCIWSHISNLDLQPLLASRSGSWTSHQIQRNLSLTCLLNSWWPLFSNNCTAEGWRWHTFQANLHQLALSVRSPAIKTWQRGMRGDILALKATDKSFTDHGVVIWWLVGVVLAYRQDWIIDS